LQTSLQERRQVERRYVYVYIYNKKVRKMMATTLLAMAPVLMAVFIVLMLWEMVWKGIALWKCGRNNQLGWYIAILILNTVGILPIVYLLFFQNKEGQM
jgi:hypothetical protein